MSVRVKTYRKRGLHENTLTIIRGAYLHLTNVGRKERNILGKFISLEGTFLVLQQSIREEYTLGTYKNSHLNLQKQLTALLNPEPKCREHDYLGFKPGSSATSTAFGIMLPLALPALSSFHKHKHVSAKEGNYMLTIHAIQWDTNWNNCNYCPWRYWKDR